MVNKRLTEYSTIGLETLGNLSSAVRLVCSLEGLAESSPATFDKLCSIHPKILVDRRVFPALTPTPGCVSPAEVLRAVKSFKNGSSGGLDGLRPQHLKDVFSGPLPIDDTLNSLTQFINLILSGACPLSVRRRPDGCTLIPWRAGRCLAWDVTVPGTLAEQYVNLTINFYNVKVNLDKVNISLYIQQGALTMIHSESKYGLICSMNSKK
ncbi:hypothetical protein HELRODRAFT_166783 [Helobdella robusta]|uniref:Uncharacterized protein n=1 Tax=Helobdella robusta TaxID=6412 RepID=T1EYI8_HELRO|nr:hypothetical protein HELRODRAFT_166783 [Helobdella robusta]ESO11754.1 hypothetical protein HELRODRAFT_166783 [Helobdella robusta]